MVKLLCDAVMIRHHHAKLQSPKNDYGYVESHGVEYGKIKTRLAMSQSRFYFVAVPFTVN